MIGPIEAFMTADHARLDQRLRPAERDEKERAHVTPDATTVYARVKRDHATIRALLDIVDRACAATDNRDPASLDSFRRGVWDLYLAFEEHLAMEEADVAPLLRKDGAAGKLRADHMVVEHNEQRRVMRELVEDTECDAKDADALVAQARALVEAFRTDMAEEDRSLALLFEEGPGQPGGRFAAARSFRSSSALRRGP